MTQEQRDKMLEDLSRSVENIRITQEQRDKMLENLSESVEDIRMTQEQRDKKLEDLSESVEDIKLSIQEMNSKIEEQGKAMQEMDNRLTAELERQRKNMAGMEYNLSEKIDALFDAREMSLEKAEKQDKKFKSIENILEGHSLRISILESKLI